jgi:hypothetical protein
VSEKSRVGAVGEMPMCDTRGCARVGGVQFCT